MEHTWLSLFLLYHDERDYRSVKLVVLFSNLVAFSLWRFAHFIGFYGPDDGSCEMINFEAPCITRMTAASIRVDCAWNDLNDSCGYAEPAIEALRVS